MNRNLTIWTVIGAVFLNCLPALCQNNPACVPPDIAQQPASQSICQGGSVGFTVFASGTGALTFQWRKNGVAIGDNAYRTGTTTGSLVINGVQSGDEGDYSVRVCNSNNGQTCCRTSTSGHLTVH